MPTHNKYNILRIYIYILVTMMWIKYKLEQNILMHSNLRGSYFPVWICSLWLEKDFRLNKTQEKNMMWGVWKYILHLLQRTTILIDLRINGYLDNLDSCFYTFLWCWLKYPLKSKNKREIKTAQWLYGGTARKEYTGLYPPKLVLRYI